MAGISYSASFRAGRQVGEQKGKLESLACCFAKLGGHEWPHIKVGGLSQSLIEMLRGRIPGELMQGERRTL